MRPETEEGPPSSRRIQYELLLGAIGLATLATCIRFVMLDRYVAPPSGDFGNYLTITDIILGTDVTGYGLRYPPLFFLLLIPFISALGPMLGLKVLAAIVASSSCVPMFLIMVRRTNYHVAVATTVLLTFSQAMAEMTAWGGSPNFLAITFILFAFYFLDRAFSPLRSTPWNSVAAGIFLGLTFETHHLSFLVLALSMALFFLLMLLWNTRQGRIRTVKMLLVVGVSALLAGLPGIPVYLRIQSNLSSSLGALGPTSIESMFGPGGLGYIAGPYWIAWTAIFVLGAVAIADMVIQRRSEKHLKAMLIAFSLAPLLLGTLVIKEAPGRVFIFLTFPLLMGLGLYIVRFQAWASSLGHTYGMARRLKDVIFTLLAVDIVVMSAAGIQWTSYAVDWYHPIEGDDVDALNWISDNTPLDAIIATSGKMLSGHKEGDRIGWWIEGYANRKSVMAGSERFRLFADEQESARDMNRFFSGTHVLENGYLMISDQYPIEYRGNPEIAARRNGIYEPILFLNDAMHEIVYLDTLSSELRSVTIAGANPTGYELSNNGETILAKATYSTENLEFERITSLDLAHSGLRLEIHVRSLDNAELVSSSIAIWCPHGNTFSDITTNPLSTSFQVSGPFVPSTSVDVSILESGGRLIGHEFYENDPLWTLPVIWLDVQAQPDRLDVLLEISTDPGELDPLSPLQYYNGYDLLAKHGIDYIYVSMSMGLEAERMSKDTEHFEVAYQNEGVKIFRVII